MASALSGILAYGLMQMKGLGGLSGWRWIFVVCFRSHDMAGTFKCSLLYSLVRRNAHLPRWYCGVLPHR